MNSKFFKKKKKVTNPQKKRGRITNPNYSDRAIEGELALTSRWRCREEGWLKGVAGNRLRE